MISLSELVPEFKFIFVKQFYRIFKSYAKNGKLISAVCYPITSQCNHLKISLKISDSCLLIYELKITR